jgi:hypothetical protein
MIESFGIEVSAVPIDTTGAAVTGDRYNLKYFGKIGWLISQGAWAGGTPAVTLQQHTAATAGTSKALAFTKYWTQVSLTGTVWTETAVVSNTYNLAAVANTMNWVEVDAEMLDGFGGYSYASLNIATPGANADLICVVAFLGDPRYAGAPATHLPNAKV